MRINETPERIAALRKAQVRRQKSTNRPWSAKMSAVWASIQMARGRRLKGYGHLSPHQLRRKADHIAEVAAKQKEREVKA